MLLAHPGMTVDFRISPRPRPFSIEHEQVCGRCGHGESLHPLRDLACLLCDQRAMIGLPSSFCVGFLAESPERELASA